MDTNGLPLEGFPSTNLPLGLGAAPPLPADMSLAMAPGISSVAAGAADVGDDMRQTDGMTESEMEHLILQYKDSKMK